jgi:hypothetical protein
MNPAGYTPPVGTALLPGLGGTPTHEALRSPPLCLSPRLASVGVATQGNPAGYQLAYEQGLAAVAEYTVTLKETRDRVGALLSAAGLIVGLGGTLALSSDRVKDVTALGVVGGVIAAASFVVIAVSAVWIWGPMRGTFVLDAGVIVGSYVEGDEPASIAEIHRELALHLGRHSQELSRLLDRRLWWFTFALVGFLTLLGGLMLMILDVAT